jgi:hypothetical protein
MTTKEQIAKLMREAQPEVRSAIAAIFRIEKEHAYQARPVRLNDQVREAIREAVK